jgi:hypothetical protein
VHFLAGVFIGVSGAGGQFVRRSMNIGIFVFVKVLEPVDDGLRLLSGRGVVQPYQLPAIDALLQDGKVAPDQIRVEGRNQAIESRLRGTVSNPGTRKPVGPKRAKSRK